MLVLWGLLKIKNNYNRNSNASYVENLNPTNYCAVNGLISLKRNKFEIFVVRTHRKRVARQNFRFHP